ncbi:MAG: Hsp20/alpha crystallin family protein [Methanosarcinaceae archaeon]|nr:Hsp20/alpha crystallin family protein [Methanosarcinaceae archaeon]MDD4332437.1 Hsp20/alpha crystallin family protein [Methanosarcinaceae archaeon]MDD4749659.1 Hsp20/alpha crystallin family protein [Methanosarcinaceae archaeon]
MDEIRRTQERLNQLFEDFGPSEEWTEKTFAPLVDIMEEEDKIIVTTDLPGVEKEDIELNLKEDLLEINAKCGKEEEETEKGGYFRKERSYTRYYRAIRLPTGVSEENAKAKMENGVLTVTLPKLKLKEPKKKIRIE